MTGLVATATTTIEATKDKVWKALTDPDEVKAWFFGTDQRTDWTPGSPITWSGEWEGKPYEDKGEVVAVDEPHRFEVTHWSPLTGTDDAPENYHTLVYTLDDAAGHTEVTITQDNNGDDKEVQQNADSWSQMLGQLKKHVEAG
ncbi:MAG: SRPBCC family protein [Lapillicoccus sp.]